MAAREKPFFVYELVDPRNGWIFYVGKGRKNRPQHHTNEAKSGKKSRKCNVIRQILAAGLRVIVVIVRRFRTEDAAYNFEKRLISGYGLKNLTNVTPGGRSGGGVGSSDDPDILMVYVLATLYRGTGGLLRDFFDYHGARVPYTIEDKKAWGSRVWKLVQSRGHEWAWKHFGRYNVNLIFQSAVQNKAPCNGV